ncbi:MAG TPA: ABC transporter ATP-binding protein, partial [Pseudobdellovibrionaceae bacterium]|nr:ABC transporter ATP-binding protein [Pseudobdellovibrionaceae bacterium]
MNNVSYDIYRGETLGIVGESGCGKSVTSFSLMQLIESPGRVSGGQVFLRNRDLLKLSEKEMESVRGGEMAMIFQEPMTALNPVLTIGQQIDEQVLRHKKCSPKEAKARSIEMLSLVGIPSPTERYNSYPHQLSGGMRQRAMIAMALSCDPVFLIADEPTTALDVTIQAQILELIQSLQEKF